MDAIATLRSDRITPSEARAVVSGLDAAHPGHRATLRLDNWLVARPRTPVETRMGCLLAGAVGRPTERAMRRLASADADGIRALGAMIADIRAAH